MTDEKGGGLFWLAAAGAALSLAGLWACQTPAQKQAAQNADTEKRAAAEINRICALPEDQRSAELKKIKEQSGMVLYCGNR